MYYIGVGVYFGLLLINLSFHACSGVRSCKASLGTLHEVLRCPQDEAEWNRRAFIKNCTSINQTCSERRQFQYHCILNQYGTKTVEVCAPVWFLQGFCASYWVSVQGIDNFYKGECFKFQNSCPRRFSSNESYKYQDCYLFPRKKRPLLKTSPNSKAIENVNATISTTRSVENTMTLASIFVGTGIMLIVAGIVLLTFFLRKRKLKQNNQNAIETSATTDDVRQNSQSANETTATTDDVRQNSQSANETTATTDDVRQNSQSANETTATTDDVRQNSQSANETTATTDDGEFPTDAMQLLQDGEFSTDATQLFQYHEFLDDATQLLQDGEFSTDATQLFQDHKFLGDATQLLQDGEFSTDATQLFQDHEFLNDATQLLQDGEFSTDATQLVQDHEFLNDAKQLLQDGEFSTDATQLFQDHEFLDDATQLLQAQWPKETTG